MRVLVSFMILCLGNSAAVAMQGFEPEKNLEGVWELDFTKTAKLWDTPELNEFGVDIRMVPVASPKLIFSQSDIKYDTTGVECEYEIKSFDDDTRILTVVTNHNDRKSTIQFEVPDDNTLILDMPASILGPVQVAYTRLAPREGTRKDSPLANVAGDWFIDEVATRKLWEKPALPECLANYQPFGEQAIQSAQKIKISDAEIEYSDQTFEPWRLLNADAGVIHMQGDRGSAFEVRVHSEKILQLIDKERRLLAIYKRAQNQEVDIDKLSIGNTAGTLLERFRPIEPRRIRGVGDVIARSGSVEIDEISIERSRDSYSTGSGSRSSTELTFFVGLPERHYGCSAQRLIKLTRLDDVYDDQGALLLTEEHREEMRFLKRPVMSGLTMSRHHGETGPGFSIHLDAPSIGASRFKKISGEIELTRVSKKRIRFSQVDRSLNKDLTHPLLDGETFRAQVIPGEFPKFAIFCPRETMELIQDWYLVDASGQELDWVSTGSNAKSQTKGFDEPIPEDIDLIMVIYDREAQETYPFSFEDISIQ